MESFIMAMGKSRNQGLYTHCLNNRFSHKQHKLTGDPSNYPYNRNINKRREGIKHFLDNLMKDHGVFVPGRVASHYDLSNSFSKSLK
uniref:Uncharacterized protein n=1 Tax=Lepeophtheirus salmonis TaxID=72036 RepID=A0A0K2UKX0_LEPSM